MYECFTARLLLLALAEALAETLLGRQPHLTLVEAFAIVFAAGKVRLTESR